MGGWTSKDIPSQAGKVAIVTGANSGVGYITALELGRAGAHVILACRDEGRGTKALNEMRTMIPTGSFELQLVDLSSLASVKAFCDRIIAKDLAIDLLINNAGMAFPDGHTLSKDGFEITIAANHLGHFAMTGRLLTLLQRSTKRPRIVIVSSPMAWQGSLRNLDLVGNPHTFNGTDSYCVSKLLNLAHASELNRRFGEHVGGKLRVVMAHPGFAASNIMTHVNPNLCTRAMMQSCETGALPILRAATDPTVEAGEFIVPRATMWGYPGKGYLPRQSYNFELTLKAWEASVLATGVAYQTNH